MLSAVCAIALLGAVSLAVVIACKKLDIPGDCRTCSSAVVDGCPESPAANEQMQGEN